MRAIRQILISGTCFSPNGIAKPAPAWWQSLPTEKYQMNMETGADQNDPQNAPLTPDSRPGPLVKRPSF